MYHTFSDDKAIYIYSSRPDGKVKEETLIYLQDADLFDEFTSFFAHCFVNAFANIESVLSFPNFENAYFFTEPYIQRVWVVSRVPNYGEVLDNFEILWDTRNLTYTVQGKTYDLDEELWEYIGIVDAIADTCNEYN